MSKESFKRLKKALCVLLVTTIVTCTSGCSSETSSTDTKGEKTVGKSVSADAGDYAKYVLVKAEYPRMAPYPDESKYYDEKGNFNDDDFSMDYEAWRESQRAVREQKEGYSKGLDKYFAASARVFLVGANKENRVYSPVNIFMALAMLAETADGDSRQQILDCVGLSSVEELREKAKAIWTANYCDDGANRSIFASSMWVSDKFDLNEDTLKSLASNYYASSFKGTMGDEAFDKAIQAWLNEQTGGLLEKQAGDMKLDPETVIALATTVYFQSKWQDEFSEESTESGIFHSAAGDENCKFMKQGGRMDDFYYGEGFSAVRQSLALGGDMWFILPDEDSSADRLLQSDTMTKFFKGGDGGYNDGGGERWADSKRVILNKSIPKFDVCSDMSIASGLKDMGIKDVFDAKKSDFAPLTGDVENMAVGEAKHAARVKIDEEGCTAAAYTVIPTCGAGMPKGDEVDFILDRPFLFVITGADGLPLFVGVVNHIA